LAQGLAESPHIGTDSPGLEERGLDRSHAQVWILRKDQPLRIVSLSEMQQDRPRLPDDELVVLQDRNLVVRIQVEEWRLLVFIIERDAFDFVVEAEFLERNRNLPAVRGRGGM
ncbi:MAG: hypothetical protein V3T64_13430, partial [Myxococcota bacterium]